MLVDRYGRPFLKMRYIVEDVCNYNCIFCHFEGQLRKQGAVLTAEDYGFATSVFYKLGVADFKITGGEPLLRHDVDLIVAEVAKTGASVSITTNGYFLRKWVDRLYRAGLRRLNVSIHTADPDKYAKITATSRLAFKEVLRGLYESRARGVSIKLNVVVLKGVNVDKKSVKDLIRLASSLDATLQFIELMPSGWGEQIFSQYYEPIESLIPLITELGGRPLNLRRELHNRPLFQIGGVVVELVKNYNNPAFCNGCTTMRLTSDGKLKTCIYAEPKVDLLQYIKNRDVDGMIHAVRQTLWLREPRFKYFNDLKTKEIVETQSRVFNHSSS
ncbi:MAG: GTP 3',8-cyclase MoaA [Pyrobaculum sp.]